MNHAAALEELVRCARRFPKCHWGHNRRKLFRLYSDSQAAPSLLRSDEVSEFLQELWVRHLHPRPYPDDREAKQRDGA